MIDPITPVQSKYYSDNRRFIVVAAGRRSRKTLIAKQKIFNRALKYPGSLWFHGAPTRQQAKDIFWQDLLSYAKGLYVYKSDTELYIKLANESEIHVIGMDKPERIEGRTKSWNGCHLAEFGDFKPDAWTTNIRPVLADTGGSAIIDGVPDPYKSNHNNYKSIAQYACGGSLPTVEHGKGVCIYNKNDPEWSFYHWFSSDVLPQKEIESIKETTDPLTYRIEYEASFESISGRVYYSFSPDHYPVGNLDRSIKYDPSLPVVMGFDFNVSPMTALLGHVRRNPDTNLQEWHLFKGYFLKTSNTRQLIDMILADFPQTYSFYLTPCQSSTARQSSQEMTADGFKTDLYIIKDRMRAEGHNFKVLKRSKNPPTYKGVRALNSMLNSKRLRFNPDDLGLKEFQKDLETLTYKEGTSAIDESDVMRNHISAGARYVCEYHWPVKYESISDQTENLIL